VGVAEGDEVSLLEARRLRHLQAEGVGPVLGPVERVQRGRPVDERDPGPRNQTRSRTRRRPPEKPPPTPRTCS
jgi:hypothetical protein